MTHVYLVRHGQASAGTDNYDRLSEKGQEQARLLGEFWNKNQFRIDAAFAGTLQRQQHTAQISMADMYNKPDVQTVEALNEYDHNTVDRLYGEGMESAGTAVLEFDQYVDIMSRWRDAPQTNELQSWDAFAQAGWNAINDAVKAYEKENPEKTHANLVFFTSGGVVATIVTQLLSSNFQSSMHSLWQLRNASITHLDFNGHSNHGAALVDYNTVTHLQLSNEPALITQI